MHIILTNDDGIRAAGLRAIYRALKKAGHSVQVIAPLTEQSAVGHAITMKLPLRVQECKEPDFYGYGINGTPTDCMKFGLTNLLEKKPDLIISGMNNGANVGPDIMYSGTVAAATEAACHGFKAVALSYDCYGATDLDGHAEYAVNVISHIPWDSIPYRSIVNVNLPNGKVEDIKGLRLCPQTTAVWVDWYVEHQDPRGGRYWWVDGEIPLAQVEKDSDRDLLNRGYATITPLQFDFTNRTALADMKKNMTGIEVE